MGTAKVSGLFPVALMLAWCSGHEPDFADGLILELTPYGESLSAGSSPAVSVYIPRCVIALQQDS